MKSEINSTTLIRLSGNRRVNDPLLYFVTSVSIHVIHFQLYRFWVKGLI
jgi:hypothetical protein